MKKSLIIPGLLASLLISGFSTPTGAGPEHKHRHSHDITDQAEHGPRKLNMKRMMRVFSQLDLSDEQRAEIKNIIKQGFESNRSKREEIQTLRQQVHALKQAEVIDEQSIRATAIGIANLRTDLILANLQNRKNIETLLNPTQLEKLQAMKEQRKTRRQAE